MAIIAPGKGRAVIENHGTGLRITIPARTELFTTGFLGIWLIAWAFGEIFVPYSFLIGLSDKPVPASAKLFVLVCLAGWTLGGLYALSIFLWNVAGKEIIELTSTSLKRRKQIPIFSRSKEYAVACITGLRTAPQAQLSWPLSLNMNMIPLGFRDGTIAFDYGRDTHHLGSGLDEADARYVIAEMCKRVKSLCPGANQASG